MKQKKIVLKTPSAISVNLIFLIFSFMLFNNIVKAQNNKWVAPKEADNIKNPLTGNTTILKDAKVLYTSYCVPCHGEKGKGDGVAAAGNIIPHTLSALPTNTIAIAPSTTIFLGGLSGEPLTVPG
mgnify:CR=1 FL=1